MTTAERLELAELVASAWATRRYTMEQARRCLEALRFRPLAWNLDIRTIEAVDISLKGPILRLGE